MTPPPSSAPAHETFLILPQNQFAFTAVSALVPGGRAGNGVSAETARPARRHKARLVYLEGPAGTGKSHLARYLVREVRQQEPRARTVLVTASQFASELAEASEQERVHEFQRRYRAVDLLVCEDLTALENRRATQEQLVAAIDDVVLRAGGRVLLTCHKPPRELAGVLPRLASRCRGGVYATLALPDREAREKLLSHFADTRQIAIRADLIRRLAEALPVSPRELLAVLEQLEARARLAHRPLDDDLVIRFLRSEEFAPAATLPAIARAVAREFGVPLRVLRDGSRSHSGLVPRRCAMLLARELTGRPLREIAQYFGRNNHSTVVHACQRLEALLEDDAGLRHHLAQIRQSLGRVDRAAVTSVRRGRPGSRNRSA
ncbi:MAG TPA: DnaA/Hda family protein [Planctomycetaceae bacterium]|nr:DnaA/Hda family protein [Planctomycetaceae bacterium]